MSSKYDYNKLSAGPLASAIGVLAQPRALLLGFLILACVTSSIAVAFTSHQSRSLTSALRDLDEEEHQLQLEWQTLTLEHAALTEPSRIESLARKRLDMHRVDLATEQVVSQ